MYLIEQDGSQARLAYSLQCRANLQLMQLTTSSGQCIVPYTELPSSRALTFAVEWEAQEPIVKNKKLTIPVRFGISVSSEEDVVVLVSCVFRADYELAPEYQAATEEIEAFRASNAIFNCYPYFREYVQNTLSRMNYPPLSIPFLRLVAKPMQPAKDAVIEHRKSIDGETTGEGEKEQKRLISGRTSRVRKKTKES